MGGFPDALSEANQIGVNFVLADLDVAMTFMDVADASRHDEIVRRNHDNAHKAYDVVVYHLAKLTPDAGQREVIDAKLAILKTRLQAVGHWL